MTEAPPPKRRALVADDDPDIGRILRVFLQRMGYEVEVVPDGEAAIERIAVAPPHVLFTDYMMPRKGGIETVSEVKKSNPEIRIVVVTAQGAEEVKGDFARAGADAFVEKPFTFATIKDACGG